MKNIRIEEIFNELKKYNDNNESDEIFINSIVEEIIHKNKLNINTLELLNLLLRHAKENNTGYMVYRFYNKFYFVKCINSHEIYSNMKDTMDRTLISVLVAAIVFLFGSYQVYFFFNELTTTREIYYKVFNIMFVLSIVPFLYINKSFKALGVILCLYIFIRTVFSILNEYELIYFPYNYIFDMNLFSLTMSIFFIVFYFEFFVNELLLAVSFLSLLKLWNKIETNYKNVIINYNSNSKKFVKYADYFKSLVSILFEKSDTSIDFDSKLLNKPMHFLSLVLSVTYIIFIFSDFLFIGHHNFYYFKNNDGYCSNLNDNILIGKWTKENNSVLIINPIKIPDQNILYKPLSNHLYIYEIKCNKKIIL